MNTVKKKHIKSSKIGKNITQHQTVCLPRLEKSMKYEIFK